MAQLVYDETGRLLFTKEMKEEYTILFPTMLPVHFGLMMVMNLCVGTLTPPVGAILFAGCRIANVKIEQVIKMLLPYFGVVLVCLILVTYIPFLSMAIPNALGLVSLPAGFNMFFVG